MLILYLQAGSLALLSNMREMHYCWPRCYGSIISNSVTAKGVLIVNVEEGYRLSTEQDEGCDASVRHVYLSQLSA